MSYIVVCSEYRVSRLATLAWGTLTNTAHPYLTLKYPLIHVFSGFWGCSMINKQLKGCLFIISSEYRVFYLVTLAWGTLTNLTHPYLTLQNALSTLFQLFLAF